MATEKATDYSERDKARGRTPSQQELKDYHEGEFQTHDPVTGEERGDTGGNWQDPDNLPEPIDANAPEDTQDDEEKAAARRAAAASRPVAPLTTGDVASTPARTTKAAPRRTARKR